MNKIFFLVALSLLLGSNSYAQKFGFIDADFILGKMEEYQTAQQAIQEAAGKWQEDINAKRQELEEMRSQYEAEEIMLDDDMKQERLQEIKKKDDEVSELQQKIFGYQGLFFNRQKELIRPAQEKLYEAVQKVARANKLQVVYSNSEGLTIIYLEPRHDYTEEVLKELKLFEEPQESPEAGKN